MTYDISRDGSGDFPLKGGFKKIKKEEDWTNFEAKKRRKINKVIP